MVSKCLLFTRVEEEFFLLFGQVLVATFLDLFQDGIYFFFVRHGGAVVARGLGATGGFFRLVAVLEFGLR